MTDDGDPLLSRIAELATDAVQLFDHDYEGDPEPGVPAGSTLPGKPPPAPFQPSREVEVGEAPDGAHLTDHGNSIRLARQHGQDLRHCHPWRQWLVWDGRRWRADDTGEVARRAKRTVADLFRWTLLEMDRIRKELEGVPGEP
jgi:hypothetical protein